MKVGFTGTREGMSDHQKCEFLIAIKGATEFHHGDCIGADEEADALARTIKGIQIVIHPPDDPKYRAYCAKSGDIVWEPLPYLERNQDIVDETERLIGAPKNNWEELRSGTWSTVRYARKQGKPILILNRHVEEEQ